MREVKGGTFDVMQKRSSLFFSQVLCITLSKTIKITTPVLPELLSESDTVLEILFIWYAIRAKSGIYFSLNILYETELAESPRTSVDSVLAPYTRVVS